MKTSEVSNKRPSDEVDTTQLRMARDEGKAYQASVKYMADEVADSGDRKQVEDYIVAYAQERAEGMYVVQGTDHIEWVEPQDENCHLEISVSDADDGRFIPYLNIEATIVAPDGQTIGPLSMPFLWHPGLYHYGRNIRVPADGQYLLHIKISPPTFMRHDKVNGRRYSQSVEVDFPDMQITTGQED